MNINEIRDLIGNGNLKDALAALFNAEEHLILKIKNELTLLKARLSSLQENEMLGLIDSESTKISIFVVKLIRFFRTRAENTTTNSGYKNAVWW